MYSSQYAAPPNILIGFHGCDRSVRDAVLCGKEELKSSQNDYDWLGNGIYFWENNPNRALEYAVMLKEQPKRGIARIEEPSVLGAIIDLGYCLNLFESKSLMLVKKTYELVSKITRSDELPKNKRIKEDSDLLLRNLDCFVIQSLHAYNDKQRYRPYDSVRGGFLEGKDLYENSGFKEKNHIQICVRNPNRILGYFLPIRTDGMLE